MTTEPVFSFRIGTSDDAGIVRDIVRAAYAKWIPVIGREPMPMKADYDQALRERRFDLLSLNGVVAGLIETTLRPDHLWIENVAVRPDSQGKGLGRRLLAHAEQLTVEQGLISLRLLTNAAFADNVALYEKLGYRVDLREPFMGGITLYMSKEV